MTNLSVNLNKIALLRNSRGRDYPNVLDYAARLIAMGAHGITVHPRPDQRHIKRADTIALAAMLKGIPEVEFNVEGYPDENFLQLIALTTPAQCTLVPDSATQLTSEHGWQVEACRELLAASLLRIHGAGSRAALFVAPEVEQALAAKAIGYDRIELYTASYALQHGSDRPGASVIDAYRRAKDAAVVAGLGVNAGHDLDLNNLEDFLAIGDILEVSIGHALIVESIEQGIENVVRQYLQICRNG